MLLEIIYVQKCLPLIFLFFIFYIESNVMMSVYNIPFADSFCTTYLTDTGGLRALPPFPKIYEVMLVKFEI
jgi:hypothetical protein